MKKEIKLDVDGFTLLELMIVLSIAAILVAVAVPSFRYAMQNNRAYTQSNGLLAALNLTRSEAIKRRVDVSICSSSDQATCAAGWSSGWIVVYDDDDDADTSPVVIQSWEALTGNPALTLASGLTELTYQPTGSISVTEQKFTLTPSDCNGAQVIEIEISSTGRASINDRQACP